MYTFNIEFLKLKSRSAFYRKEKTLYFRLVGKPRKSIMEVNPPVHQPSEREKEDGSNPNLTESERIHAAR